MRRFLRDRDERGGAKASSRLPSYGVHAAAAALLALTALADGYTDRLLLLPVYALPVALAGWGLGRAPALGWAAAATIAALVLEGVSGSALDGGVSGAGVVAWNTAAQLAALVVVALAASALRARSDTPGERVAETDDLTGVLDGASFRELVDLERSRALRHDRPFTLAYLDADRFRQVNELRGYGTGDRTLQLIASVLRDNLRSMDSVARLGGDEFGLLLPETGKGAAELALAKLRSCLAEAMGTRELPITFSIGVVICLGPPESVDRLIHRAHALMYRVKDAGGDGLAIEVLDDPFGIEAILQRS